MTLQRLKLRVVYRPDEVHDAVSRPLALLSRRRYNSMTARAEDTVRELHACVAEIDNGTASLRLDPEPFAWAVGLERASLAGGLGPDLEAT